jgi:hypothetical protein
MALNPFFSKKRIFFNKKSPYIKGDIAQRPLKALIIINPVIWIKNRLT